MYRYRRIKKTPRRRAGPLRIMLRVTIFFHFLVAGGEMVSVEGQGPVFVLEPPARVDIANTSGGRIDCQARGSPQPTIHWTEGEQGDNHPLRNISGLRYQVSNGTLVFPPFQLSEFRADLHRTMYRCVASNSLGTIVSRYVRLRTVKVQDYEVDVRSTPAYKGNIAVLHCVVPAFMRDYLTVTSWLQDRTFNIYPSGEGDGKYQMLPSGELVVQNVGQADAFSTYECRVAHRLTGQIQTSIRPTRIQIIEPDESSPPHFSERLLKIEAKKDEMVILPCISQCYPPPEYRWELHDKPISDDVEHFITGGGALLVIPRAAVSDVGRYTCIASNSEGSSKFDIHLQVQAPLTAHVTPNLVTATLGQEVSFQCSTTGSPIKDISWMKDGQSVSSGGSSDVLRVGSASKEAQGMYQCVVSNEHDSAQSSGELRLGDTPPQLTYKFIRQTVQPGPSVSLKCICSGNPTPNVKWTLDGFAIPQNQRFVIGQFVGPSGEVISHVNITSVRAEDGGSFRCTAVNRVGEDTHSSELNVYGLPYVRPMGDVSAVAGESFVIQCPVSGYPIYQVKWYKGDRVLPLNKRQTVHPNSTLVVEKVQAGPDGDGGAYRCTASDKLGRSASGNVHVKVMVPPKITPFSFRSDLLLGERVGVQCVISKGDPPLTITWLKDGQELLHPETTNVIIRELDEFTSILSIGRLERQHGGNYTCLASNSVARSQHTASLSVNVPPAITPFSFGELSLGERLRVTCSVKRGDPPVTINWFKDNLPLDTHSFPGSDITIIRDLEDFSSVLAIPHVDSRHSGNYTCMASNPAKRATYTAALIVTVPPTWVVEPQNKAIRIHAPVILDCKVDGFPHPVVTWKKMSGETLGQYHDVSTGLQPNGSLVLKSVGSEDQGQYLCEASNGIGEGLSSVVTLTVNSPVHFKVRSAKEISRRGSKATIRCEAQGDLPMTITWRRDTSFMDIGGRFSVKNVSAPRGQTSELTIAKTRTDDSGLYTCFGRNRFGYDQSMIHLMVQDVPGMPLDVRLIDHRSRQMHLEWSVPHNGNSPISRYVIRYAPLQGGSWMERTAETSVEGIKANGVITNLRPFTIYSIQIIAENSIGLSEPSSEVRLATDEEPPSAAARNIRVEAASSTTLLVSWDPPPREQWNGALLGHNVGFREVGEVERDGNTRKKEYNLTTVLLRGTPREEVRLTGLNKFCQYAVIVQPYNKRGPGPQPPEILAQTLEDVPEAPPRLVTCEAKSAESIEVKWQPPPEPFVNGIIQGYRLIYRATDYTEEEPVPEEKVMTTLFTTLHGLLKYTNYSIEILAFTRVGNGVKSQRIFCRTEEDVPDPPASIKAMLATEDSAVVTWLPPLRPNGIILRYGVYVRILENGLPLDVKTLEHPPGTLDHLQYTLTGLQKRHTYEFFVTAFTKVGEGQSSDTVGVTPFSKVNVGIVSFGGTRVVHWKTDVRLQCRFVGLPQPTQVWRNANNDAGPSMRPTDRIHFMGDGSLQVKEVQRVDQGDYSCVVFNEEGKDLITYILVVHVPPGKPLLLVTASTEHSLQLQWKLGDDGGSPILGFIIHYKVYQGKWQEVHVSPDLGTYNLENLRCGTIYYVSVTAYNRVGSGSASKVLPIRTRGNEPTLPLSSQILKVNSTLVEVHLNIWPDGGCPILYFVIEYALGFYDEYTIAGNNIPPDRVYILTGLVPASAYRLRITAYNSAGINIALYKFGTLNTEGEVVIREEDLEVEVEVIHSTSKETKTIWFSVGAGVALLVSIVALYYVYSLRKKDHEVSLESGKVEFTQGTEEQEPKVTVTRRPQNFATVRKPSSPAADNIPEYPEDIRPYATSQARTPALEETALQTFSYREDTISPARRTTSRMRDDYRVRINNARSRSSDVYDSDDSDSDTDQRCSHTVSSIRTEGRSFSLGHHHAPGIRRNSATVARIHHESVYAEWPARHHPHTPRRIYHPKPLK